MIAIRFTPVVLASAHTAACRNVAVLRCSSANEIARRRLANTQKATLDVKR